MTTITFTKQEWAKVVKAGSLIKAEMLLLDIKDGIAEVKLINETSGRADKVILLDCEIAGCNLFACNFKQVKKIVNELKLKTNDSFSLSGAEYNNNIALSYKGNNLNVGAYNGYEVLEKFDKYYSKVLFSINAKDIGIDNIRVIEFADGKIYASDTKMIRYIEVEYPEVMEGFCGEGYNGLNGVINFYKRTQSVYEYGKGTYEVTNLRGEDSKNNWLEKEDKKIITNILNKSNNAPIVTIKLKQDKDFIKMMNRIDKYGCFTFLDGNLVYIESSIEGAETEYYLDDAVVEWADTPQDFSIIINTKEYLKSLLTKGDVNIDIFNITNNETRLPLKINGNLVMPYIGDGLKKAKEWTSEAIAEYKAEQEAPLNIEIETGKCEVESIDTETTIEVSEIISTTPAKVENSKGFKNKAQAKKCIDNLVDTLTKFHFVEKLDGRSSRVNYFDRLKPWQYAQHIRILWETLQIKTIETPDGIAIQCAIAYKGNRIIYADIWDKWADRFINAVATYDKTIKPFYLMENDSIDLVFGITLNDSLYGMDMWAIIMDVRDSKVKKRYRLDILAKHFDKWASLVEKRARDEWALNHHTHRLNNQGRCEVVDFIKSKCKLGGKIGGLYEFKKLFREHIKSKKAKNNPLAENSRGNTKQKYTKKYAMDCIKDTIKEIVERGGFIKNAKAVKGLDTSIKAKYVWYEWNIMQFSIVAYEANDLRIRFVFKGETQGNIIIPLSEWNDFTDKLFKAMDTYNKCKMSAKHINNFAMRAASFYKIEFYGEHIETDIYKKYRLDILAKHWDKWLNAFKARHIDICKPQDNYIDNIMQEPELNLIDLSTKHDAISKYSNVINAFTKFKKVKGKARNIWDIKNLSHSNELFNSLVSKLQNTLYQSITKCLYEALYKQRQKLSTGSSIMMALA